MNLRTRCGWTFSGLLVLSSCTSESINDEANNVALRRLDDASASTSSTLKSTGQLSPLAAVVPTQSVSVQMTLPSTLTHSGFLVGQTNVKIDSRVTINGTVWSAGTFSMEPDATAQDVTCSGNVYLADRDSISKLTVGGTVSQGNNNYLGTVTRTPLTNVTRTTTVTYPVPSQSVTLNSGQNQTLNPGSYVNVTANSGSTLTLLPGDYYFTNLVLESSSVLKLNQALGATRIFITSGFTYRTTIASGTNASRFFVEYLGTNPLSLETPFQGSVIAPRASLTIGTANSQVHRGAFMAQSIEVQPNVRLEYAAFDAAGTTSTCAAGTWDHDGNPFTLCVNKTDCVAGSYVATEGSTTSNRTCLGCSSGQFSLENNALSCTAWSTCQAGTFVANTPSSTVDRICAVCPTGKYSSGDNQSQCISQGSCDAGTVQTVAGTLTSPPVCTTCEPGQYCAGATNPRTICAAGTWDDDSDPATICVAKTNCTAGTAVSSDGSTTTDRTCSVCEAGHFSTEVNAPTCTVWESCAAGTFVSNTPSSMVNRTCVACPSGQFSDTTNAASCTVAGTCPVGTAVVTPATSTSDVVCSPNAPPVLLMHMDEALWSGTVGEVVDSSGHYNDGTALGGVTTNSAGKFGRGGQFSGSGFVTVADSASLRPTSALTLSAWIYPTNVGFGYGGIIAKRTAYLVDEAYDIYLDPNGHIYVDVQSPDDRFATNATFQNNTWYHVAVVFDGTLPVDQRVRVYINGILDVVAPESSTSIEPYTSNLYVGMLPNGGDPFVGTLDEVAIWTRALTQPEIVALASATSAM